MSLSSAPSAAATPPFGLPPVVTTVRDEGEADFARLRHSTTNHPEAAAVPAKHTTSDRCFETLYKPLKKPRAATAIDAVLEECSSTALSGFCARCRSCPPSSASWRRGDVHGQRRSDARAGLWTNATATASSRPGFDANVLASFRPFSLTALVLFSSCLGLPPAPPERRHDSSDRLKPHKPSIGLMPLRSFCRVFYRLLIRPFCPGDFSEPWNATEWATTVRSNKRAESNIEPCKTPLRPPRSARQPLSVTSPHTD